MAKAVVTFFKCIQDSQEYGSNDEHMVSRVFFKLEIEGKEPINLESNIKQTVGSDYDSGPIEVSQPHRAWRGLWGIRWPWCPLGYTGPFNYQAFRDCAEKYYRSLVGAQGSSIRIGPGSKNIRMRDNVHQQNMKCEFEIDSSAPGW